MLLARYDHKMFCRSGTLLQLIKFVTGISRFVLDQLEILGLQITFKPAEGLWSLPKIGPVFGNS